MDKKAGKKRGRKPKSKVGKYIESNDDEMPIITHLRVQFNASNTETDDIFVKSELNNNAMNDIIEEKNNKIKELESTIKKLKKRLTAVEKDETIVYEVDNSNINMPCWWCRHDFTTPKVQLVEKYYDDIFYVNEASNFCSYECCEAYNIDLNDNNVSERSSLLRFHYYKTFGEYKNFKKAPHWSIIKGIGGCVPIEKFRDNFTYNNNEYYCMKPPMISRLNQVEKISLVSKPSTEKIVLKRSKPINSTKISLKNTLGLSFE